MEGDAPQGNPDRIVTGIAGLDSMLYGGIPVGNQVALAGGPGCGKSLICLDVLYNNAKAGTPCAFIALEETAEEVIKNVKSTFPKFDDIDSLIASKKLNILGEDIMLDLASTEQGSSAAALTKITSDIENIVKTNNAKLVAIDSISVLKLLLSDGQRLTYRRAIVALLNTLKKLGVTTLLTIEMHSIERKDLKFTEEFFIFDGIIALYQTEVSDRRVSNLEIIKMRGTKHSQTFSPYDIMSTGFRVLRSEDV